MPIAEELPGPIGFYPNEKERVIQRALEFSDGNPGYFTARHFYRAMLEIIGWEPGDYKCAHLYIKQVEGVTPIAGTTWWKYRKSSKRNNRETDE